MFEIVRKEVLSPVIILMDVYAPRVAASAKPGQFVIVRATEDGERIPLTICDYDVDAGTVTIVIQIIGASSAKICALSKGESIMDFVGPLGEPAEFVLQSYQELKSKNYVFIAGGLGIAPIYPQVKYMHSMGIDCDVIIGARSAELLILEEELKAVCANLYVCTDDGSKGDKGVVTKVLKNLVDSGKQYDQAVAIGPMLMMKFVQVAAAEHNLPLIVSLNTLMVDGTGMCGACRVTVDGQTKFACMDGPEFDAHKIDFDEAIRRQTMYKNKEVIAKKIIGLNDAPIAQDRMRRVPVREQDPEIRAKNFEEVCYGYNAEEAVMEASRCIQCKKPLCVGACPVSVKIPMFIKEVAQRNFKEASRILAEDNSLPAVCGRVCPQESQCEGSCILGKKGDPVAIGKLERFVADWSRLNGVKHLEKLESNGKKVAVVGSGPAGLACATDLAKYGYDVTIFEVLHKAGGVLQYGIPEFRLPKATVVQTEIDNVLALGVKIETNIVVGRTVQIDDLMEKEGFSAVFVASGAGLPKFMGIKGEGLNGVFSANEVLTRSNLMRAYDSKSDTPIYIGSKVAVIGGGNVAMDAARTALRLGAEVSVIYRRTEKELPARVEEIHHAKEEGVIFRLLSNPIEILGDDRGWVTAIKCEKMELGEPDESGRRSPVAIPGSEYVIDADVVIMALGTAPNPLIIQTTKGLEATKRGGILADEKGASSRKGIYAGGDAVSGAATVILAMGAGRKAAAAIHEELQAK